MHSLNINNTYTAMENKRVTWYEDKFKLWNQKCIEGRLPEKTLRFYLAGHPMRGCLKWWLFGWNRLTATLGAPNSNLVVRHLCPDSGCKFFSVILYSDSELKCYWPVAVLCTTCLKSKLCAYICHFVNKGNSDFDDFSPHSELYFIYYYDDN